MIRKRCNITIIIIIILLGIIVHGSLLVSAGTTAEESSKTHGEEGGIFKVIAKWINFAILVAILYYFLVKVMDIPGAFKKLSHAIVNAIQSSSESKEAALRQIEEIKGKLANLESEVEQIKAEALRNTELEKMKTAAETETEMKRIHEMARGEIDWKMKEAIQEFKQHTINLATSMSEQIIKSQLKSEEQEKLIEKYIIDLGNRN